MVTYNVYIFAKDDNEAYKVFIDYMTYELGDDDLFEDDRVYPHNCPPDKSDIELFKEEGYKLYTFSTDISKCLKSVL